MLRPYGLLGCVISEVTNQLFLATAEDFCDALVTMKFLASVFLICLPAIAQVKINEIVASNTRSFADIVDFDDYPDWIELKNTGATSQSLSGFFLSDDPGNPFKWPFPDNASLAAGAKLLVMADSHDAVPGQTFPRGYWPWRNFTTERYHTNFSLSSDGESLSLTQATGISSTVLVQSAVPTPSAAATWRYLDNGSDQSTQWRARVFDDSAWAQGKSELGYSDAPQTTVSFGSSSTNKQITTYFRHSFEVANPALYHGLIMDLLVDDGCVVYLNGAEVVRRNMPAGDPNHKTLATIAVAGTDESTFFSYNVAASHLIAGTNVLAVEVHQSAASSSDLSLDLKLTAKSHTSFTTVDSVSFGKQVSDVSYGRDATNPSTWKFFAESTPGNENTTAAVTDIRLAGASVSASLAAGVYSSAQSVALTTSSGEIRYTTDGSEPDSSSTLYTSPVAISANTVLRARSFASGRPPGAIMTRTYFINETQGSLPMVSVVADPETLFGNTIGIYYNQHEPLVSSTTFSAIGMRDVYKGKDAPGHVEFFAPDGTSFRANCGIRMGGENNWVHPQRALNLAVRGKYGDDEIKYHLWPSSSRTARHTGLTLRDGGDRWANEMLRDCFWPRIAHGYMNVDTAEYRPTVVYINGQYFGLHDMRERWDDMWFYEKYRVSSSDVDHLLYGHVTSGDVTLGVEAGSNEDWLDFMTFINTADLTQSANWAYVESRIDVESFMDFVIAESYGNNSSWFHNREFWKQKKAGARWKWFLTDMDRTFSTSNTTGVLAGMLASEDVLVRLKANSGFKTRLAQRYAAHMAGTFAATRLQDMINQLANEISASEVSRHEARWWTGSTATSGMTAASRASGISSALSYVTTRAGNWAAEVASQLGVSTPVDFTVQKTGSGSIRVQGVPVTATTFKMFPNVAFSIEAIPAPGYVFQGWSGLNGSALTTATITGATSVTANFVEVSETLVGGTLATNTTLTAAASPYIVTSDLIVPAGVTLSIEAGVTVRFMENVNLRVMGALQLQGSSSQKVTFSGRNGASWGGVSFESPSAPSSIAHLIVRNATHGFDPTVYPYAISGLNATLVLDYVDIQESQGPIFCRGGHITLSDSILQTPYTGDGINIKQGGAITRRCVFLGNNQPDTDAIDYDGVVDGIIEDCRIYRFQGSNSDGVDFGEGCVNVLAQRNMIYFNSDKGFSVGQSSTVTLKHNLVVGCTLGIGIKDAGSSCLIDQNTFVDCDFAVALYEKNFGDGGGSAIITHSIISKCGLTPVTADSYSTVSVNYCLCDTVAITGTSNLFADPRFVDAVMLNFELLPTSPAINSGSTSHALDPDNTIADRGMRYTHSVTNYPYTIGETIVVNEILANSNGAGDWIELHNRTAVPVNIGGWFLSDSALDLTKYRIPLGTIIPAGGFVTFTENLHFGASSIDPNKITPFALSDIGETVYLSSAVNDELTDYQSKEEFGPSLGGETLGTYYKPSSGTWNFVAMRSATPGSVNSGPRIGPIVISEIMYNPLGNGDAEYIELLNVSQSPITLFDTTKGKAWRISDGIEFEFSAASPLTILPGGRVILTKSLIRFNTSFGPSLKPGTPVLEWITGGLNNGGENLQLDRPGGVDANNILQYVRVDRVNYDDDAPWVTSPDGTGPSLNKISENDYGNDFINWVAKAASPGNAPSGERFATWSANHGVSGAATDSDGDGYSNLVEYAFGSDPSQSSAIQPLQMTEEEGSCTVEYHVNSAISDIDYQLESSYDLQNWTRVDAAPTQYSLDLQTRCYHESKAAKKFFRLSVTQKP